MVYESKKQNEEFLKREKLEEKARKLTEVKEREKKKLKKLQEKVAKQEEIVKFLKIQGLGQSNTKKVFILFEEFYKI